MKRSPNLWRVSQIVEPDSERAKKESESKSGEKAEEKTEEQDEKEKSEERIAEAIKKMGEEDSIKRQ